MGNYLLAEKKLILVVDQACEAIAAAKANAIIVVGEIDISAIGGNAGARAVIQPLLIPRQLPDRPLRISRSIFEYHYLHSIPPINSNYFRGSRSMT